MYGKILRPDQVAQRMLQLRVSTTKIVFTNGCFDILHAGHIEYLMTARSLGTKLVIGVNDDASVQALKGLSRPFNKLEDRMVLLSALQCVDYVVPFSEETPARLIEKVRPHLLVKGGDYTLDQIVGADFVKSIGGEVSVIAFKEGYSTTGLEERIRKS